jgi:hypothetical protein
VERDIEREFRLRMVEFKIQIIGVDALVMAKSIKYNAFGLEAVISAKMRSEFRSSSCTRRTYRSERDARTGMLE